MLVLTRRVGEKVQIGDGIVVTIVSTRSGRIRVGIDAPRDIRISRAEAMRKDAESDNAIVSDASVLVMNSPLAAEVAVSASISATVTHRAR